MVFPPNIRVEPIPCPECGRTRPDGFRGCKKQNCAYKTKEPAQ